MLLNVQLKNKNMVTLPKPYVVLRGEILASSALAPVVVAQSGYKRGLVS